MIDDPEIERRMLFAYEETGPDRFRAAPIPSGLLRLYGGQILARALRAMQQTVSPDRPAHSFHAFFGKTGLTDKGLHFAVTRDNERSEKRRVGKKWCSKCRVRGSPYH